LGIETAANIQDILVLSQATDQIPESCKDSQYSQLAVNHGFPFIQNIIRGAKWMARIYCLLLVSLLITYAF
jgi:hypothetical protein